MDCLLVRVNNHLSRTSAISNAGLYQMCCFRQKKMAEAEQRRKVEEGARQQKFATLVSVINIYKEKNH